jgi:hypothetical protein
MISVLYATTICSIWGKGAPYGAICAVDQDFFTEQRMGINEHSL